MRETETGAEEVADGDGGAIAATRAAVERDRALAMIGQIYDAALEPSRWPGVIRGIVEFVDREATCPDRECDHMRVLVPHLARALRVMVRLRDVECKTMASLAALERVATGVLLLEERGHAIFTNRSAQRTLDERDGLTLRSARFAGSLRKIAADDEATQSRIDDAIRDCLDERAWVARCSREVAVRRRPGRHDLALQFAPLPRASECETDGQRARVIVFLTDPEESSCVTAATLARLYKLTAAEGRLALALLRGETLAEAAHRHGVTVATARTQLAAVFQKTGTTRQPELVRLLVALGSHRGEST